MCDEYLSYYKTYTAKFGPKVAIFLMVGVFYEMYDELDPETGKCKTTLQEIVDLLGLKVSIKKNESIGGVKGPDSIVAGIPDYCVTKWAGKLTQIGWTVVLIEQVKNAAGKVTARAVERILTPGTHIEAATNLDIYITYVSIQYVNDSAPNIAIVTLDLTTGHLHVFETQAQGTRDAWTTNDGLQFMELYPPKEVLWSSDCITEIKLRSILGCSQSTTFHQRSPLNSGAWLTPAFREEYLRKRSNLKTLLPTSAALHIVPHSHTETALLSLFYTLEELWPSMNLGTLLVYPWIPGSTLHLGENALVQLHMIVQDNNSKQDVLGLLDRCATPMGHRGIRERLLKPSADSLQISNHLNAVEAWTKKESEYNQTVVKRLRTMTDVHRLYRKIQQGTVQANDIINFDMTFRAAAWIAESEKEIEQHTSILEIRESIFRVFSVEKVYQATDDISLFVTGLVPSLDTIEKTISNEHKKITNLISEYANCMNISPDSLKPEFRDKSLVIKGPRAIIQAIKSSGKLKQGTQAIVNKGISYIESTGLDTIFATLSRLRETLKKQQAIALIEQGSDLSSKIFISWMKVADWITQCDLNLTLARMAKEYGYVRPTIIEGDIHASVKIENLRHPLLEAQDRKIPYVHHNVDIGIPNSQGWLLYGLNASGKSSLMRAVGLAVLLAQGGSFVPATKMILSPFKSLHTRIINTDNLWMGLSSFAVEMSEMRDIFRVAGSRSLVLGDELCSGTETTSATALVAAGLKGLLKRGARFLFATHLHGLSQIEEVSKDPDLKIQHLHVEYDRLQDKLIYHRTLRTGSGSSLYGLEVAKAMRIPDDILEYALRFRKQLTGEVDLSQATGSSWNSSVIRRKCDVCGSIEANALEVHHIQERNTTNADGRLSNGSSVHSLANLIVLCDKCHDDVHRHTIHIGSQVMTSHGEELSIRETLLSSEGEIQYKKSKWTKEEEECIISVCRQFPKLTISNLSKFLLNQHDIKIGSKALEKFKLRA